MAMDPITNPFAPGAGIQPPELAGRNKILDDARTSLGRVLKDRPARSQLLLGLRGVGKTVLLNRIAEIAEETGHHTVIIEAPEDRGLAEMLIPPLRKTLFELSVQERSRDRARRALAVLRSFAGLFKAQVGEVEFSVKPEMGAADSGNLESDLAEVLQAASTAAKSSGSALTLFVDEVQYLSSADLGALIVSVHKMGQKGLPFLLIGAGLPQLAQLAGEAKSYAERLFDYPEVGALTDEAAREAIKAPMNRENVDITEDALATIQEWTKGYPFFLQEWGSRTWLAAESSPITADVVQRASQDALNHLDAGFFRVRLDRLTPREKDYVRAMAELGPGPHRSGEIAQLLGMNVTAAGPLRNGLIKKGMIYSPQHGDTVFTVPMFDQFMVRSMPGWKPGLSNPPRARGGPRKKRRS
jgi:hypothetical protein